jgi:hypothetical protein
VSAARFRKAKVLEECLGMEDRGVVCFVSDGKRICLDGKSYGAKELAPASADSMELLIERGRITARARISEEEGNALKLKKSGLWALSPDVRLSGEDGNMLSVSEDGLYARAASLAESMARANDGAPGRLLVLGPDGQASPGGYFVVDKLGESARDDQIPSAKAVLEAIAARSGVDGEPVGGALDPGELADALADDVNKRLKILLPQAEGGLGKSEWLEYAAELEEAEPFSLDRSASRLQSDGVSVRLCLCVNWDAAFFGDSRFIPENTAFIKHLPEGLRPGGLRRIPAAICVKEDKGSAVMRDAGNVVVTPGGEIRMSGFAFAEASKARLVCSGEYPVKGHELF